MYEMIENCVKTEIEVAGYNKRVAEKVWKSIYQDVRPV